MLLLGYNKLEVVAATNEYIFCGKSVGAIPTDFFGEARIIRPPFH